MFTFKATQTLARMGLNTLSLEAIERDALLSASLMLEQAEPKQVPTFNDLLLEANAQLPSPRDRSNCLRLFWGTRHHVEDIPFSNLTDLASFISQRSSALESIGDSLHSDPKSLQGWSAALGRLAEGYSYVIEAALTLQSTRAIPVRQQEALLQITTIPDENSNFAGSMLFMRAMSLYTARQSDETSAMAEKPC